MQAGAAHLYLLHVPDTECWWVFIKWMNEWRLKFRTVLCSSTELYILTLSDISKWSEKKWFKKSSFYGNYWESGNDFGEHNLKIIQLLQYRLAWLLPFQQKDIRLDRWGVGPQNQGNFDHVVKKCLPGLSIVKLLFCEIPFVFVRAKPARAPHSSGGLSGFEWLWVHAFF